jgi:RNA polymerase sigma factor (sigma-70 family)
MNNDNALKTKEILDSIAESVRNVLYDSFPRLAPQEREDIEQTVKLKIWRTLEDGKDIVNFRSYLWKTVYTTALDEIGKRINYISIEEVQARAESLLENQLKQKTPELITEINESMIIIRAAMHKLPKRRKVVVELYLMGMELTEISDYLEIRQNQARHLLYRGLQQLEELARKSLRGLKSGGLVNLTRPEEELE